MKLVEMKCPNCGAKLEIDGDYDVAFCDYCDTKIVIDREIQHVQYEQECGCSS